MAFVYKPLPAYSFADEGCKNCKIDCEIKIIDKGKYEEANMKKEFTKDMLENRMVIEYRGGFRRMVVDDLLIGPYTSGVLDDYYENLLCRINHNFDIVKVYRSIDTLKELDKTNDLLWERKEIKEVTMKEVAEKFGCEVKIIDG